MYLITTGFNYEGERPRQVLPSLEEALSYCRETMKGDDLIDGLNIYTIPELKEIWSFENICDYDSKNRILSTTYIERNKDKEIIIISKSTKEIKDED